VNDRAAAALATAKPAIFWTDGSPAPQTVQQLRWGASTDLVIVGGGFTGLWAAILASDDQPGRSIAVLEAARIGFGASSRNGGFLEASITHGLGNGVAHWPNEITELLRMGDENYREILAFIGRAGADVGLEENGVIHVATDPWHLDELEESAELMKAFGIPLDRLDADAMRACVHSPTYLGGLVEKRGSAIVDPARLVSALRTEVEARGVVIFEDSAVVGIDRSDRYLEVRTASGSIRTEKVIVATNAYASPGSSKGVRSMRRHIVPVHDYVLMTEPLSDDQRTTVGWTGRQGLTDVSNQFHYYRLTSDHRILWGGYDAVYRFGSRIAASLDTAGTTHHTLAEHFFTTFPQLTDLTFTHRWAGPIGTTSRFTAAWGSAFDDDLVWVGGYTGLGVGASRFGARVALDLVDGRDTERTQLAMVRKRPMPFPPEPFRYAGIELTRRALARADDRGGRRGPWLRILDRFGVGFDS
jgi:glycine/D-amino acid oxidase-like deaminating enzyme